MSKQDGMVENQVADFILTNRITQLFNPITSTIKSRMAGGGEQLPPNF